MSNYEDVDIASKVHEGLMKRGVSVWFDKVNLRHGRWKQRILKAIPRSRFFIILVSESSLRKLGDNPGFQDEELQHAYTLAMDQPQNSFSTIPVRIEDSDRGDLRLTSFQQFDLFSNFEDGLDRLATNLGGVSFGRATKKIAKTEREEILDSLLAKCVMEYDLTHYEKADTLVDVILELSPSSAKSWDTKGVILAKLGRMEEAVEAFGKALSIEPNAGFSYNKSVALWELGHHSEAFQSYATTLSLDPQHFDSLFNAGLGLVETGCHEQGLQLLDAAEACLRKRSTAVTPIFNQPFTEFDEKAIREELEKQQSFHESVLRRYSPELTAISRHRAMALTELGRMDEGLEAMNEALRHSQESVAMNPEDSQTLSEHGLVLMISSPKEALNYFKKAVSLARDNALAWNNLALGYVANGQQSEALSACDKALELEPDLGPSIRMKELLLKSADDE